MAVHLLLPVMVSAAQTNKPVKTFERSVAEDLDALPPLKCDFSALAEPTWFGFGEKKINWSEAYLVDRRKGGTKKIRFPSKYKSRSAAGMVENVRI